MTPRVPGIGTDGSLLSCILRAAVFADADRSSPVLSGVALEPCGNLVRCAATDGKGLAAVHCSAVGIDIAEPVVISRDAVARVGAIYRTLRRSLERMSWGRRVEIGTASEVEPPIVARIGKGHGGRKVVRVEVPQLDELFALGLVEGSFPKYQQVAERKPYRRGFPPGVGFDIGYLLNAQRVLGQRVLTPYHGGRGVFFKGDATGAGCDWVLVMPVTLPDKDKEEWIFGDAAGAP